MLEAAGRPEAIAVSLAAQALRQRRESGDAGGSAGRYGRFVDDPVGFVCGPLGEELWSKQREIAEAVREHRHVAVRSAHDTGKSFIASRLAAWWLSVHAPGEAFVVTTAPTFAQVRAILWREIHRAHQRGKLPGRVNQTEWWIDGEIVAYGRKPADYDDHAFQGIHARYVLVILDEACGIPSSLWTAVETLATNEHSRVLAIGNPDSPLSQFKRVCEEDSSPSTCTTWTGWSRRTSRTRTCPSRCGSCCCRGRGFRSGATTGARIRRCGRARCAARFRRCRRGRSTRSCRPASSGTASCRCFRGSWAARTWAVRTMRRT